MKRKSKSLVSLVSCLALLVGMLWCPFTTPRANAVDIHYRVNCGGSAYTDTAGNSWSADKTYTSGSWGYVSGKKKSVTNAINNTNDDPLFQSYTYASTLEYKFDNIPNGDYTVVLNFAETYWSATGKRVFDVYIENSKVLSAFDIYANAGKYTALTKTFTATVSDGQLNIKGVKSVDNAMFNAIEFYSNTTPPPSGNGPTDNPISIKYGSAYSWTGNIKWSNVENILDYGGDATGAVDNIAAFNSARDAAANEGGGVVYFPAGTYKFTDNIYLKNGVVIRGATPTSGDAKVTGYAPPAKLEFPKYNPTFTGGGTDNNTAFKKILTLNPNTDSNIGVVNVDLNRAGISFMGATDSVAEGGLGQNTNIVVYGVRSNNVAEAQNPTLTYNNLPFQNAWQRYCYRFAMNVGIQAQANVLVANTRLNDLSKDGLDDSYEQIGYIVRPYTGTYTQIVLDQPGQARFDYANHYGIYVNRNAPDGGWASYPYEGNPTDSPALFRSGISIRDNWVYKTMRVGIQASGMGLELLNNTTVDKPGKVGWIDPTGTKQLWGGNTLENRGMDWVGWNVTIDGNNINVYPHQVGWQPQYYTTDGEGILTQLGSGGGALVNGANITNNTTNAYIGLYKMANINNVLISGNTLLASASSQLGGTMIYVNANTNTANYTANNVLITNNNVQGTANIQLSAASGGSGNVISGNTCSAGNGIIYYQTAANPLIQNNTGFTTSILP